MRAVGYRTPSPINAPDALLDIDLPDPVTGRRDLLVEVKAIAVNPVDYQIRQSTPPPEGSEWR